MGGDDDRKRQGPGADLFEQARQRAEAFLREVSNLGGSTQQQAGERVDQLWSVGRWSADQLMEAIRREVAAQLSSLGLATKADLDALERRLTSDVSDVADVSDVSDVEEEAAPAESPAAKKTPGAKKTAKKATAATKTTAKKAAPGPVAAGEAAPENAATKKTAAKKAAAKKAAAKKAAGSRKAAGS